MRKSERLIAVVVTCVARRVHGTVPANRSNKNYTKYAEITRRGEGTIRSGTLILLSDQNGLTKFAFSREMYDNRSDDRKAINRMKENSILNDENYEAEATFGNRF